jgi:hypothetical protein
MPHPPLPLYRNRKAERGAAYVRKKKDEGHGMATEGDKGRGGEVCRTVRLRVVASV